MNHFEVHTGDTPVLPFNLRRGQIYSQVTLVIMVTI